MGTGTIKAVINYLEFICLDLAKRGFAHAQKLLLEWKEYLKGVPSNLIAWVANSSDDAQICVYNMKLFENVCFPISFSIEVIRKLKDYLMPITLENINSELFNGSFRCLYTPLDAVEYKSSSCYSDLEDIFVIPFIQEHSQLLVVDGNHRISSLISENRRFIKAKFADYRIAYTSILKALDFFIYCINADYRQILPFLGRVSDNVLYANTNICHKKYLNSLSSRINESFHNS